MNSKFPVLSFVSILLRFFGVLIFLIGLYIVLYNGLYQGLLEPMQSRQIIRNESQIQMTILIGVVNLIFGLGAFALGEIIGVLFSNELNTRKQDGK